ncbi:Uncharacterised protein r2_g2623 [Pycnogonum litorale]
MADLPPERLKSMAPPYTVTGVDLFGPLYLKVSRNVTKKVWGAIFTCATVRAIHLELVEDLSTEAFMHALRRFSAYHGWPQIIISDNGRSFVGASKEVGKFLSEERRAIDQLSTHRGTHVKRIMKTVIGEQKLTWNEMATVFAEVQNLINSRPLTFASNDPDDLMPLSPNHFILGRATNDTAQGPFKKTRNLRKRYEFIQTIVSSIWKRFVLEYLPTLNRRGKWKTVNRQMKVGDLVLLMDPNTTRGHWNVGRISDIFPGKDGVVRNVKVKTKTGEYNRSVNKCIPLFSQEQ